MKKKTFVLCVSILLVLVSVNVVFAQKVRIASSPNPVGSGARALGMGGAFIGVADDATAASWNPGGLIQLKNPEISIVGNWFHRTEDRWFGSNPESNGSQSISEQDINYFSIAYPFSRFDRNMILSLNYQHLYDFAREWNFPMTITTDVFESSEYLEHWQTGSLSALGIAYCIQVVPAFSIGLTVNLWDDDLFDNQWEENVRSSISQTLKVQDVPLMIPSDLPSAISTHIDYRGTDRYSFEGVNFNIGMLWHPTDRLAIGMILKTPFKADMKHERTETTKTIGFEGEISEHMTSLSDEKMNMPMSYGIGVAYRFSDQLTLSADIYRTEWQDFTIESSDGNEKSPITGNPVHESDIDPTHQFRVGAEYLFVHPTSDYVVPLRGGVFYDPAPAEGSPDDFYGFSLGSGIVMGRYAFDMACQYRFGNDVGSSMIQDYTSSFSQDVEELMVYSSFIIHF